MRLFIAEKPSLAKHIASQLPGPLESGRTHITCGDGTIVTWCFGHLLQQADPLAYGEQYKAWSFKSLPILPEKWILQESPDKKAQIGVIAGLLKKATEVINAGDPDREGQVLVDELLDHLGNRKPTLRIWITSTDPTGVKRALAAMKPNSEYRNLYMAGVGRSRADWLMGMNLSRAYTIAARDEGGSGPTVSVGRVQTPTLTLVVNRDLEILNFVPKDFYVPEALISTQKGKFTAKWKIPAGTKVDDEGRVTDVAVANAVKQRVEGVPGQISLFEPTDEKQPAPLPFSLSSLQVYANKRWGHGAQEVLDGCQALYDNGFTSYPRSDCEYLPEAQLSDAPTILANLADAFAPVAGADASLKSRAWNDKQLTAHFGIIPTMKKATSLGSFSHIERNLYEAISLRYIAQFYPDYRYRKTVIEALFGQDTFRTTGTVPVHPGWKAVYGMNGEEEDDGKKDESNLPAVAKGDAVKAESVTIKKQTTTPPDHFTEGELILAMNNIHRYVDNPEIKKRLKANSGIGTEATRSKIIEGIINRGFVVKQGKGKKIKLISSEGARKFIAALPFGVKDPGMTAIWETSLDAVSSGQLSMEDFVKAQTSFVVKLVNEAQTLKLDLPDLKKDRPGGGYAGKGSASGKGSYPSKGGSRSGGYKSAGKGSGAPSSGGGRKAGPDDVVCPKCGCAMVDRTAKASGKPFKGCSGYPKCTHSIWEN